MRIQLSILFLLANLSCFAQNSIKSVYTEDVARDFIRMEFDSSIGKTAPADSQFNVNGLVPSAVIMLDDTTLYLKFQADFLQGAVIDLDYTASGKLLGSLPTQTNKLVANRITSAKVFHWTTADLANYFSGYNSNFNTVKNIPEGSIIKLAPGNYGTVDIAFISDVTFCAQYSQDSVLFTYVNFREKAVHIGLLGHPAAKKNVKIRSSYGGFFGMGIFATGRIRLENLEIYNVSQGIQVKTVADIPTAPYNLSRLNYQALVTKNIYIHHTSAEAFYIGSDVPAPLIPIHWTGYGLTCDSIGWDAYQYRNGNFVWLKNCKMINIGLKENTAQCHGFLYGTTTQGGYVENMTGSNIRGYGMLLNGYGALTIKDCNITSRFNTVYIKNYDNDDDYRMKGLVVNFICFSNYFNCTTEVEGYSLDVRRDSTKTKITVNINSVTNFVKPKYIETYNGVILHYNNFCDKKGNLITFRSPLDDNLSSISRMATRVAGTVEVDYGDWRPGTIDWLNESTRVKHYIYRN